MVVDGAVAKVSLQVVSVDDPSNAGLAVVVKWREVILTRVYRQFRGTR